VLRASPADFNTAAPMAAVGMGPENRVQTRTNFINLRPGIPNRENVAIQR
jgi:hypothetical protein